MKAAVQFEDVIFADWLADLRRALGKVRFKSILADGRVQAEAEYCSLKEFAADCQVLFALESMCREDERAHGEN